MDKRQIQSFHNGSGTLLRKTKFPDLASHYKAQGTPALRHQEADLSEEERCVEQADPQPDLNKKKKHHAELVKHNEYRRK